MFIKFKLPDYSYFISNNVFLFFFVGEWLFVVNIPGDETHEQGVVTEACL